MAMKPYGPAIFDAVERGDEARLRRVLERAKTLHAEHGDLAKAIRTGEAALKKLSVRKGK